MEQAQLDMVLNALQMIVSCLVNPRPIKSFKHWHNAYPRLEEAVRQVVSRSVFCKWGEGVQSTNSKP